MALAFANQKEATFKDGCLSVRKALLDKTRVGIAPGPIYNPKPRISSRERSLRDITFGTAPARDNDELEQKNTNGRIPKRNPHPGPQTYDPNAIRRAIFLQSNQRNVAGIKFGTGKRACNAEAPKCQSPSPAEYDPEMIRRGIMFSKSGSTNVTFGTARNNDQKPCEKPGPQTYDPEAIRKGIMFTKSKQPSVKFGTPPKKKKCSKGRRKLSNHPGPQEYDTDCIRKGVYALSTKKRPVGVKFTTGPRTYNDVEERERSSKPGPSAYDIPSALGRQSNSRYKSQPSISFGAR